MGTRRILRTSNSPTPGKRGDTYWIEPVARSCGCAPNAAPTPRRNGGKRLGGGDRRGGRGGVGLRGVGRGDDVGGGRHTPGYHAAPHFSIIADHPPPLPLPHPRTHPTFHLRSVRRHSPSRIEADIPGSLRKRVFFKRQRQAGRARTGMGTVVGTRTTRPSSSSLPYRSLGRGEMLVGWSGLVVDVVRLHFTLSAPRRASGWSCGRG
jgi:hypothetical protein